MNTVGLVKSINRHRSSAETTPISCNSSTDSSLVIKRKASANNVVFNKASALNNEVLKKLRRQYKWLEMLIYWLALEILQTF